MLFLSRLQHVLRIHIAIDQERTGPNFNTSWVKGPPTYCGPPDRYIK